MDKCPLEDSILEIECLYSLLPVVTLMNVKKNRLKESVSGFAQAWKVLEFRGLAWKAPES